MLVMTDLIILVVPSTFRLIIGIVYLFRFRVSGLGCEG